MKHWLSRSLWLAAWSFWLWLGFGLYRELPRELGPVVCRLPMNEAESTIGFCSVGSNFCGPCVVTVYPSSAALALMPHSIVM